MVIPALSCWNINPSNINKRSKLAIVMVFQESHHRNDSRRSHQNFQFVSSCQLNFLHIFRHTLSHILSKLCQILPHNRVEFSYSWSCLKGGWISGLSPDSLKLKIRSCSWLQQNCSTWLRDSNGNLGNRKVELIILIQSTPSNAG